MKILCRQQQRGYKDPFAQKEPLSLGMSDREFRDDEELVKADMERLKALIERQSQ
jgi:hypothetical protein